MANITLTNLTNSPFRIDATHFGVGIPTTADLVGTDLQIAEIYRDAGAGVVVTNSAPANTVAPVVGGALVTGSTLTTTNGTWVGTPTPTYTRVWQRSADGSTGWTAIAGATATTYVTVIADEGQFIRCVVTGANSAGNSTGNSNSVGPVVAS